MPVTVAMVLSDGLGSRGGIGRVMTYLARQVAQDHPDIHIVACRSRLSDRALLKHLTMPLALALFVMRGVTRRIDVAHINIARHGSTWRKMLFVRAAQRMGCKVILHLHGSGYDAYFSTLSPALQGRIRALFNSVDAVVALSPYWQRVIVDQLHVPAERVHVIANGVPVPDIVPSVRAVQAPPVILFMGELGPRKGTDILLAALANVDAQGLRFRAVMGGNGAVEEARQQAQVLGIADHVSFLGWVGEAEVNRHLEAATIFVLPSRAENQPLSILEAMAHGLPVVSTRVGAIPEQILDTKTGLIVEPGDAAQLATALTRLLSDPEDARVMGQAGRARFIEEFALSSCADRFVRLYRSLA